MIDYGDYFDLAAQSLCLNLKIPMIQGGTFSQCVNVEFFQSLGKPCFACTGDFDSKILEKITPERIIQFSELSFLPKNQNPVGLSNVYLCGTCGMMMVSKFGEYLINKLSQEVIISNRTIFYVNSMESVNFNIESSSNCILCKLVE